MASPPVLLVADDLSVIAAVKRVLAREGYECVLATNAADAVIAWGHSLPGLVLLQPSVESDRGNIVLEELQNHPDAKLLRVVLLGETVPGFPWPVEPLPLDPEHLASVIEDNLRTTDQGASWSVLETAPAASAPPVAPGPTEPDAWRATSPHEVSAAEAADAEVPEPTALFADPTPPGPPHHDGLEEKLFGDLAEEVEAEARQSLESQLALPNEEDDELRRLEDDVRAEANRRRQTREARAVEVKPAPPTPPQPESQPGEATGGDETSFGDLSDAPAAPPSRAAEVLARAEQMVLETRAQSDAQRKADEQDARKAAGDLDTATRRAERAEELVRNEREARGTSEEELYTLRDELKRLAGAAETERELARVRHENELDALKAETDSARAALSEKLERAQQELKHESKRRAEIEVTAQTHEQKVEALSKELEQVRGKSNQRKARLEETTGALEQEKAKREALEKKLAELETQVSELSLIAASATEEQGRSHALEEVVASRDATIATLTDDLHAAKEDADAALALATEVEQERQRLEETRSQLAMAEQHLAEARTARDEAQTEMLALEETRDGLQAQIVELQGQLQSARADATSSSELLEETAKERDTLRARVAALEPYEPLAERLGTELESERRNREEVEAKLTDTADALESTRTETEQLAATIQLAAEKVKVLEAREIMSLVLPGRNAIGIARHGTIALDGLAHVVCQLVMGNAEVKLELGVAGGTRSLWFKRGQIIAAESSLDSEGLIARARRDGLIDSKQDQELRMLRGATAREQLDALKARAFIRDIESVPLVQRYTEQVALDAFTEEESQYRIVEEAPKPEVLLATVPRPTLPMLAESLRRAVTPDVMLERLGGGEAVPHATDSELDLRALGFSERERKMLTWVDGEATVEDLSLASGLKPDVAFRALLVAKLLGIVVVKPGEKKTEASTNGQLDVHRLEAKFDEVQDADYFTILGLSRAAGTEDVRRAFQRLSQEFDPLRFSGHPDASLQQRAQVVANLLEEAAKALEDDRRRVEYARHLLD